MYAEKITYEFGASATYEAYSLRQCHFHCHEEEIEIIYLLRGLAEVRVVFENFILKEGDYVVIDKKDAHCLNSMGDACDIVSIYIKTEPFRKKFDFIDCMWFTCESFDLVKYLDQTEYFRKMITNIIISMINDRKDKQGKTAKLTERFMDVLIKKYDIRNYYNRNKAVSRDKMKKYYTIRKYIYTDFYRENLQEYIATKEHYSKSYITHLFREVGGIGFNDILIYERISRAQELLIISDLNISEVSDICGFSYPKFFNRDFKKWFSLTPSKYRSRYKQQVQREDIIIEIADEDLELLLKKLMSKKIDTEYKTSINPFSIKHLLSEEYTIQELPPISGETLPKELLKLKTKESNEAKVIICVNSFVDEERVRKLLMEAETLFEKGTVEFVKIVE